MIEISLVIVTLNRGVDLIDILSQLSLQIELEVVIVDQTDLYDYDVEKKIEYLLTNNKSFKYHKIKQKGASNARNFGVANSTGNYIMFIDDDVILSDNFCNDYINLINFNPTFDAIAGMVLGEDQIINYDLPKKYYNKYVGFLFRPMNYGLRVENSDLGTCNMIIKKEVFKRLKGFDEKLQRLEDSDFSARFLKENYLSYYEPNIKLVHKFTPTGAARDLIKNQNIYPSRDYWKQYFYFTIKNYGLFKGWTFITHYLNIYLAKRIYIKRPHKFILAIFETFNGYLLAKKMLK